MSKGCAYLNGSFFPIADAAVPITDTGFTRSDTTYDVASVWNGRFFRLDDHIDRLLASCARLRLTPPVGRDELRRIMIEMVRRSGLRNAYVDVIVTRGVPVNGQRDLRVLKPRLYAFAVPYMWIVPPEVEQAGGVDIVVARSVKRTSPASIDPTVKNFQWGDLIRGLWEAYDRGASLALLLDGDGFVTEGAGFNVFALVDGVLRTPERGVLRGITRRTVIEIAESRGIPLHIGDLAHQDLNRATELFLTSTAGGVMKVASLDENVLVPVAGGPSITDVIAKAYWALREDSALSEAVDYESFSVAEAGEAGPS